MIYTNQFVQLPIKKKKKIIIQAQLHHNFQIAPVSNNKKVNIDFFLRFTL